MSDKTLGQIAFDGSGAPSDWRFADDERWERIAQAVRRAVIEECARVCENVRTVPDCWPSPLAARSDCADAIRALK